MTAALGAQSGARRRGPPPVEQWDPPDCGEIDIAIAADGSWSHEGRPIGRPALVRLFASILRRDGDRYVLVTPVEKLGIRVEDAPFVAVSLAAEGEGAAARLTFTTNVDDAVTADAAHPLRFEVDPTGGIKPYVLVRGALWARLARPLVFDLVERGVVERGAAGAGEGGALFGVWSGGCFFPMGPAEAVEGA